MIKKNAITINLKEYQEEIYLMKIKSDEEVNTTKFV